MSSVASPPPGATPDEHSGPPGEGGPLSGEWRRLHPLSPLVRAGRLVPALALALVLSTNAHDQHGGDPTGWIYLALVVLVAALGVVRWWVTRWKLDGVTLRIETGLLRRDLRQLPVARIQAIDVVQPLLARWLGLAELRMRLAGSGSSDGRLAYLPYDTAVDLRARLLAMHHGLDAATPEPLEVPIASVPAGRLAASVLLSGVGLFTTAYVALMLVLAVVSPHGAAIAASLFVVYFIGLLTTLWRRLSASYGFVVAEAPDGVRIRRGLLQTVAETIPLARVQAVRQVEPLLWRPLGWCRLEVDIAGRPGRDTRGEGSHQVRKALLPVGSSDSSHQLVARVTGGVPLPDLARPPTRVRVKAPLSYHFLAAGHNDTHAASVTGRVRRLTCWVPLDKAQSVRRVQGPVQRRLGLATVHVDAAGRQVRAEFRDRERQEADALVPELARKSRQARKRSAVHGAAGPGQGAPADSGVTGAADSGGAVAAGSGVAVAVGSGDGAVVGPGWFPDPGGRPLWRYWDGRQWTEHFHPGNAPGADASPPAAP